MKQVKHIIIFFFLIFSFGFQSYSQGRKVEVLKEFYKQENYRILVRKATKLIDKKGFDDNEVVHLFKAVGLAKLSESKNYLRKNPDALKQSIEAYENYFELDKQLNFNQKNSVLLTDLRTIYKNAKSVSIKSEAYDYLFPKKEKTKPVILKEQVIVVKSKEGKKVEYSEDFKASEVDTVCEQPLLSDDDKMIEYAKKFMGVPYIYGGTGDGGFDCSGYTQFVLGRYGYDIPRSARFQKDRLESIKISEAKKGDLVFFSKYRKVSSITHVGIVISEKGEDLTMIHASSSRGIMITNVSTNTYWKPKLVAAGRPKKSNDL